MPTYTKQAPKGIEVVDIRYRGKTVTTVSTLPGGKPKKKVTTYKSERMAHARYKMALESRKTKGWVHLSQTRPIIENRDLERAIAQHLDDDEPRIVYGDWLLEQGDPRGDLIAVQRELRSADDDLTKTLAARERKLLRDHASLWFGTLDEILDEPDHQRPTLRATWRLGFFDEVEVRLSEGGMPWLPMLSEAVGVLATLQSSRFVRRLVLGGSADNIAPSLLRIANAWPTTLRSLCVTGQLWGEYTPNPHRIGSLEPLCNAHPQLEELEMKLDKQPLGTVTLPALRRLALWTYSLSRYQIAEIAAGTWSKVTSFELGIGRGDPTLVPKELAKLFSSTLFPALERLQLVSLRNDDFAAGLGSVLASSSLLPQLRELAIANTEPSAVTAFEASLGSKTLAVTTTERET
jgi:uncharacterized protein (TIGR02996 family)